jgi:hypothetical protein
LLLPMLMLGLAATVAAVRRQPQEALERSDRSVYLCAAMDPNVAYWRTALQNALAELDAATRRSLVNEAARRVMRAKAELARLAAAQVSERA